MSAGIVYLVPGQGADPRAALRSTYVSDVSMRASIDAVLAEIEPIGRAHDLGSVRAVLLTDGRAPLLPGMPQLASYAASVSLARILADGGVRPEYVVGQSFGEIAALVCAGAFTVAEGATAVCALNEAFTAAEGLGGMIVVGASQADTEKLLARLGRPELVIACLDSPRETIVSGPLDAVDALMAFDDAPPLYRLAVPYASHHPDLIEVATRFRNGLEPLQQKLLSAPVISPIRRSRYTDADDLREALADCVIKPVHLIEVFESLADDDRLFIEIGVGGALCRCVRDTLPTARTCSPLTKAGRESGVLRTLIS